MLSSQKVLSGHLERWACVYVRQSTTRQVRQNQESQVNQYLLIQRAEALGWPRARIRVIDSDLGLSGQSSAGRVGFQELVAEVSLGHVGIIFGYEVSRLARNNSDWYHLLDLAAVFGTLIADTDGVYDPRQYNEIVFTQMTKGRVLACGGRWDHVTDFHCFVVDDDSVDQQLYQLSALGEIELLECRLQAPAEVFDADGELGGVQLLLGLCLQLMPLLREAALRLGNLLPLALELVPADHLGQVHLEQAGLLALQLCQRSAQGTLAILQRLGEPLTRLGACQFMGDEGRIGQ
jgi:hypothetical protein